MNILEGYEGEVCLCPCVFLLADWELAWVVSTDAVVVAVVRVADRGTAVVRSARLRQTFIASWALQQPVTHITLQTCKKTK